MTTSEKILLEIRNLSVSFQGKSVIRDFSLVLRKGETAAAVGESGTGKTTLLRVLLGFVRPESGEIRIRDKVLDDGSVWTLRRSLGYVPQEPDLGCGLARDVLDRIFSFRANRHLAGNRGRLDDLLRGFRLDPMILDKSVSQLSGGEKQRVVLAASLALGRDLYLLDEPTSALDEVTKDAILDYLRSRTDLTILAVTHDREFQSIAGKVLYLDPDRKGARR